jgi:cell division protein FtsQ
MTAYQADVAVARPATYGRKHSSRFRLPKILGPSVGVRRDSVTIPLARRLPRFLGTALTLGFFGVVTYVGLWQGGHLNGFIAEYGEPHHALARMVGLGLEKVTISGISQIRESEVLAAAGLNTKVSLAFLDVNDIRERLERVPMIKSASVRKLYPNELVISLTERVPYAIWQLNGELFVIASDGTVIDLMQDERFLNLPFVVGDQANTRTKEYLALLEAAGPLKERIRAGSLVSGRRWTLKMDNGMDVRLPELGVNDALARLVTLERDQKILEKDVLAIDLRMPDRVVVRLTEEAASARAEAMKKKPMRGKGVDT